MVGFKRKAISNPPSFGEILANRRQGLKKSISEAAKEISISEKYLNALEGGKYDQLPGEVYLKNFLKTYSKYLGLDYQKLIACYQEEKKVYEKTKLGLLNDFKKPVARVSSFHFVVTPKLIRGLIIATLVICCLVYLGLKVRAIMSPPLLIVNSPAADLNISKNFIEIQGEVEKEAVLEINSQQVLVNPDGTFSEIIDLMPGVNLIEIQATKRHGNKATVYRQIIVSQEEEGLNNE